MKTWRQNLVAIWFCQFLSLMGFFFAMPFAPFYLQELGITDPVELKVWVSLFAVASPLAFAIFAPIWGYISDRYGRRPMLLRATLGAAVVLTLMGTAQSPQILVFYRLLQGILTGTMVAAQTMVSVSAPHNRRGMALGSLNAAVFGGMMAGVFIGGIFAEMFGYRNAFLIAGIITMVASIFVLFGITENFTREPEDKQEKGANQVPNQVRTSMISFLFLTGIVALVVHFDSPWLPLLVQEIHQSIEGSALRTGALGAAGCVSGMLSGLILGRMTDRVRPPIVACAATLGAGLFIIPQGLAQSFGLLFATRFGMVFFTGGLDTVFQIWLSRISSEGRRGLLFGWSSTARSLGLVIAPMISGMIASGFGVRSVFFLEALLFLCLAPFIIIMGRKIGDHATSGL